MVETPLCGLSQFLKADAARFRGAGAGKDRRIQHIQVEGEVDRFALQLLDNLLQGIEVKAVCSDVGASPGKLLPVARADAELEDAAVAHKLPAAAHDAGVGERNAQIVVPHRPA